MENKIISTSGIHTIHDGLWITCSGDLTTFINPQLAQALHYPCSRISGTSIRAYIDPSELNTYQKHIDACKKNKFHQEIFKLITSNGSSVTFLVHTTAIYDDNDNYQGCVHSFTNEIAKKNTEDLYRQQPSYTENNTKTRQEFMAHITHELRTPLTAILGFSQVLLGDQSCHYTLKQKEYLNLINQSGVYLLELVNDILDFSKLEANKFTIEKKPFDINKTLARTIQSMMPLAMEKHITIHADLDNATGLLDADETRVQQIVYNLLSNAIKFTKRRKHIGLICSFQDGNVILNVWDQGIGIKKRDSAKIFEPFEQVASPLQNKQNGSGLGLAIVKKIVALHGGSMTVISKTGQGTTFTIALPGRIPIITQSTSQTAPSQTTTYHVDKNKSVLVVDDDKTTLQLLEETLKKYGYTVLKAQCGEKALEILKQGTIDCVITDIIMPGMSGFELLTAIRSLSAKQVPVIALTGFTTDDIATLKLLKDFDYYCIKPVNFSRLEHLLRSIFYLTATEQQAFSSY